MILTSCGLDQLALRENSFEVESHILRRILEKLGDLRLRQPERLVLEMALDARAAILGLVEGKIGPGLSVIGHDESYRSPVKAWCNRDFFNSSSAASSRS